MFLLSLFLPLLAIVFAAPYRMDYIIVGQKYLTYFYTVSVSM